MAARKADRLRAVLLRRGSIPLQGIFGTGPTATTTHSSERQRAVALDPAGTPQDLVLDRVVARIDIPPMPLAKALREFEAQTKVTVFIAPGRENDIRVNGPVEAHLQNVPVFDALEMILNQVPPPPEFGVRGDRLIIGDPGDMEVRLYDV
jgi:hypothetical protein